MGRWSAARRSTRRSSWRFVRRRREKAESRKQKAGSSLQVHLLLAAYCLLEPGASLIPPGPGALPVPSVCLIVLDGWGLAPDGPGNAIGQARTPVFDELWSEYPHARLRASGRDVGLPDGQMGNSEVGHLNIGAGRVVMQELPRITQAVEDGILAIAPALTGLISRLRASGGVCHLVGLVSTGGVHSHQDHAAALAKLLGAAGIGAAVHVLTDGRDTPPESALRYVAALEHALPAEARIATVGGRYYAMDRDRRWDRTEKAYLAIAER